MILWGITAYDTEASIAIIDSKENKILFAASAERFTGRLGETDLDYRLIYEASKFGKPDKVIFYEDPTLKRFKHFAAKDYFKMFFNNPMSKTRKVLESYFSSKINIDFVEHQESHAGWAYLSPYDEAAILVVDSINSLETASIWKYSHNSLRKIWSIDYPDSIELFYTCFTEALQYIPNKEEFMTMDISNYGRPTLVAKIYEDLFVNNTDLKYNLGRGIKKTKFKYISKYSDIDIANSVQHIFETIILGYCQKAKDFIQTDNLVFSGRSALNCILNTKLSSIFKNVWIAPNPTNSGTSIGAIAAYLGRKIKFNDLFLGYNIDTTYPKKEILRSLIEDHIALIANGKAEFGSRSLGNRTIIGSPKLGRIVEKINNIKKRGNFRPFTVSILEEKLREYFEVPDNIESSRYSQYQFKIKTVDKYHGIISDNGYSKVHTVSSEDNPNLYGVLKEFYDRTECPLVLSTGLNLLGRPMINSEIDIDKFEKFHKQHVFWRTIDK